MHGITKTFRRKTEELEHPVQLCIYISNHNVTQSILLTWRLPAYQNKHKKRGFLQARQKKNFIFHLTQQKQKAFFFFLHSFWPSSSTQAQKSTFTHQHTRVVSIISEFLWSSPPVMLLHTDAVLLRLAHACDGARPVFANPILRNTTVSCSVWTFPFSRISCTGWGMFGDNFNEFKTMVVDDN